MRVVTAIATILLLSAAQSASVRLAGSTDLTRLIGSEPPPKQPPCPVEGKWTFVVSGKIELHNPQDIDLKAFLPHHSLQVRLDHNWPGPEGQADSDGQTLSFIGQLGQDGRFKVDCTTWSEVWPEDGTWDIHLQYDERAHKGARSDTFSFSDGLVSSSVRCQPSPTGFDLGTHSCDLQSLISGDYQVVIGTIVDSEGSPFASSWAMVLAFADGDGEQFCRITTDRDGRFLGRAWMAKGKLGKIAARVPELRFGVLRDGENWPGVGFPMQLPRVGDAILDFGTTKLQRGVVRVSAALAQHTNPEVQRLAELCGLYESAVYFNVRSQPSRWAGGEPLEIPFGQPPACFWLPEGEYQYRASHRSSAFFPADLQGSVSVPASGVVHLSLKISPEPFVALHLTTNAESLTGPSVRWTILRDGKTLAEGSASNEGWVAVPTCRDATTRVHLSGYKLISQTVDVAHGQGPVEVKLRRNELDCEIEIEPPAFPDDFSAKDYWGHLQVVSEDGGSSYWPPWLEESRRWKDRIHAGKFQVFLGGGELHGYESGRLTEPITIQTSPEVPVRIKLPAIAPPPWKHRAGSIAPIAAKCGDNFVQLTARGADTTYDEGDWRGDVYVGLPNDDQPPRAGPIRDGEATIPVSTIPPSQPGGIAAPTLNLPVRLVANLDAFGRVYGKLSVKVSQPLTHFGSHGIWDGQDVSLWAPPGPAIVEVTTLPFGLLLARQQLTTTATEVVTFAPVSNSLRQVSFQNDPGPIQTDSTWTLYRRTAEHGEYTLGAVKPGDKHLLAAGQYALFGSGEPDKPTLFEVFPDNDVSVVMGRGNSNPVPRSLKTHLLLRFDLGEGEYHGSVFECLTYHGDAVHRGNPLVHRDRHSWLQAWRVMRTGALMLDWEFVEGCYLTGSVSVIEDGKLRTRVLQPRQIRLDDFEAMPDGTHSISVRLINATRLADAWLAERVFSMNIVEGCPVPSYDALPPGRHRLAIAGQRSYRLLDVEVPDQREPLAVPESVAKAARELD